MVPIYLNTQTIKLYYLCLIVFDENLFNTFLRHLNYVSFDNWIN